MLSDAKTSLNEITTIASGRLSECTDPAASRLYSQAADFAIDAAHRFAASRHKLHAAVEAASALLAAAQSLELVAGFADGR